MNYKKETICLASEKKIKPATKIITEDNEQTRIALLPELTRFFYEGEKSNE